jgi:hypothetical protein
MFIPMCSLIEAWLTKLAELFSCKLLHDAVNNPGYIESNGSITHTNDKKGGKGCGVMAVLPRNFTGGKFTKNIKGSEHSNQTSTE